ncbi:hypothetical protein [Formosa algae]|uniref:hypothetical protein n=1 Tax=Formosa algae TaxID=225843 RepID=UPI001C0ED221|nr:hypothetical protein [Formosa algae]
MNSDIENGTIKADAPAAQLYNLKGDVNQNTNGYSQFSEVVKDMDAKLKAIVNQNKTR